MLNGQELELNKITGTQKVAIILLSISEENATKILSLMSEEEIKEVSFAMSNLTNVSQDSIDKVIDGFSNDLAGDASLIGSFQSAEKLLEKVLGKDKVLAILEEIKGPQGKNTWEKLGNVNEEVLSSYLKNEHPQTIAMVLSKLSPDHTAKIIPHLSENLAYEVIIRILNIGSVKKETVDRVEKILRSEFISSLTKTHKHDSFETVAEIFNSLDRKSETKFMGLLEKQVPESAEKIKSLMFTFEDLGKLAPKGVQSLLKAIDKTKLTIALKGANEKVRDLFISNMSQRAAKILLEEMQGLGPVRVREVEEAQLAIVSVAKDLMNKGEIEISEDGKDEFI
jgi:flagellar motor switch protein FliG